MQNTNQQLCMVVGIYVFPSRILLLRYTTKPQNFKTDHRASPSALYKIPLFSTRQNPCRAELLYSTNHEDTTNNTQTITCLPKILLTQPCDTLSWRLMSHGRTPLCESSTIFRRMGSGRGRPLTNMPPSWFTPPCPLDPFAISEFSMSCSRMSDKWSSVVGCRVLRARYFHTDFSAISVSRAPSTKKIHKNALSHSCTADICRTRRWFSTFEGSRFRKWW